MNKASTGGSGWQYDEYGRFDMSKAFETRTGFPEMAWVDKALYGGIDGWDKRCNGDTIFGYSLVPENQSLE